jgi:hypothetical protein
VIRRWLVLGGLLASASAMAMSIRTAILPLAWSRDGTHVLILTERAGPEGGGSRAYAILPGADGVVVSSNFSPGNGTRPESVSVPDCRRLAGGLRERLGLFGIEGVKVDESACANADREVVVASQPATAKIHQSELGVNGALPGGGSAGVTVEGAQVQLRLGNDHFQWSVPTQVAAGFHAFLSLNQRLLVVVAEERGQSEAIVGAFVVPSPECRRCERQGGECVRRVTDGDNHGKTFMRQVRCDAQCCQ